MPAPEPPLKIVPSSTYQLRIESIVSSTERMKQADACWGTPSTPMLNHTGELNAACWVTSRYLQLVAEGLGLVVVDEVAVAACPTSVMVSTTRSMTCFSERSRSAVPRVPRKYFWATMLVALTDHVDGELDAELLEGDRPVVQLVMRASRRSHVDLVVGVDPLGGEVAADADAGLLGGQGH